MQTNRRDTGFTLIEVMVVVVILGILASIIIPKIMDKPDQARVVKAKQDIQAIQSALEIYRLDNYVYPTTDQGLDALVNKPSSRPPPPPMGPITGAPAKRTRGTALYLKETP